jgi:hypothetical protein
MNQGEYRAQLRAASVSGIRGQSTIGDRETGLERVPSVSDDPRGQARLAEVQVRQDPRSWVVHPRGRRVNLRE